MRELVVLSGKGGSGKTSLVGAFASLAKNSILCDADVDASDLHLILNPTVSIRQDFQSGHSAFIDPEKCVQCGVCRDLCQWNAINENFVVDSLECEGCGVCFHLCPEKAIEFPVNTCGEWFISQTRFGPMVHARLNPGEENSGKLVAHVRQQARSLAEKDGLELIITDGPPGIGCPVIASLGGATAVVIVTEPTVSGAHDMERVLKLINHFHVPAWVIINKADLNPDMADRIEREVGQSKAGFLGRVPFDQAFTEAMVKAQTLVEYDRGPLKSILTDLWRELENRLQALPST